jgi:hypothetical protein
MNFKYLNLSDYIYMLHFYLFYMCTVILCHTVYA